MKPFFWRDRTESDPVCAAVDGDADAAVLAWRADLRARLDAQLSRATEVTLAAAESWVALDDPPPKEVHLAEALSDAGLWGSEDEPGTHIARRSEDDGAVVLRAWDWDLSRPLAGGGHMATERVRTIPWPGESERAYGLSAGADSGDSEAAGTFAPLPVQQRTASARGSDEFTAGPDKDHDPPLPEMAQSPARLEASLIFRWLTLGVCLLLVNLALSAALGMGAPAIELVIVLRVLVNCAGVLWFVRRWQIRRKRMTLTVGDTVTLLERAIVFLVRILVAGVVWFIAMMIAVGTGAPSEVMTLCLTVPPLLAIWWHVRRLDRPAEPSSAGSTETTSND